MRGTYTFRQDGLVIAEHSNLITTRGADNLIRYLAGYTKDLGRAIALGIGDAAASVNDTMLDHEIVRVPVESIGADIAGRKVIFKSTMPSELKGSIYESGVWTQYSSTSVENDSRSVVLFDEFAENWNGATLATALRAPGGAVTFTPAQNATQSRKVTDLSIDFSGYSGADRFNLAMNSTTTIADLVIRLGYDDTNYFSYSTGSLTSGYRLVKWDKSAMTKTGTLAWSDIQQIEFIATGPGSGSGNMSIESFRIEDTDSVIPEYALLSRSVFAPVTKIAGVPLEVEYKLEFTL